LGTTNNSNKQTKLRFVMTLTKGIGYRKKKTKPSKTGKASSGGKTAPEEEEIVRGDNENVFIGAQAIVDAGSSSSVRTSKRLFDSSRSVAGNSAFRDSTSVVGNCADCCLNPTKRQQLSTGTALEKVAQETSQEEGLTTEGLGMKIAQAWKIALSIMAQKKIMVDTIAGAFGLNGSGLRVIEVTPQRKECTRAPFVTPKKAIENPVQFDGDKFCTALDDGITPLPASTASRNWGCSGNIGQSQTA
jgi:hypothetical protein